MSRPNSPWPFDCDVYFETTTTFSITTMTYCMSIKCDLLWFCNDYIYHGSDVFISNKHDILATSFSL